LALLTAACSLFPSLSSTNRLSLDAHVDEFEAEIARLRSENEGLVRTNRLLKQQQQRPLSLPEGKCSIPDLLPLEEHFHVADVGVPYSSTDMMYPAMTTTSVRLEEMDENNVTRMVISQNGPGLQDLPLEDNANATVVMRALNEGLLRYADAAGGRFRTLCNVHLANVSTAISELQWCSSQGMPGVMLHGHEVIHYVGGRVKFNYYYHMQTIPFWKECVRLGMFVYLHPACMSHGPEGLYEDATFSSSGGDQEDVLAYANDTDAAAAASLDCSTQFDTGRTWGFSLQVAQVVSNLILHKLFDEVPDLQMVIGHQGELVTYWLWRIDHDGTETVEATALEATKHGATKQTKHGVSTRAESGLDLGAGSTLFTPILQKNFYVTTSGFFDTAGLKHLLSIMPAERLLFSADTPYEQLVNGANWLRGISSSDIDCETLQKIGYKNAEKLLNWTTAV